MLTLKQIDEIDGTTDFYELHEEGMAELRRLAKVGHAIASMPKEQRERIAAICKDHADGYAAESEGHRRAARSKWASEDAREIALDGAAMQDEFAKPWKSLATILAGVGDG